MEEKTMKMKSLSHRVGMIAKTAGFLQRGGGRICYLQQKLRLLCCCLVLNESKTGTL